TKGFPAYDRRRQLCGSDRRAAGGMGSLRIVPPKEFDFHILAAPMDLVLAGPGRDRSPVGIWPLRAFLPFALWPALRVHDSQTGKIPSCPGLRAGDSVRLRN